MKKILVSACLYGEICKYNATDNSCLDERFLRWKSEGRLIPVCPEVIGGLPTPREPSERRLDMESDSKLFGIEGRVITKSGKDVTAEYVSGAKQALRIAKDNGVICCILKHKSPSCGNRMIYDGTFSGHLTVGEGVTVEMLRHEGFAVFNETELDEAEKYING